MSPSSIGYPVPPCPTIPPPPPPLTVTISPAPPLTLPPLGTLLFTATVANTTNQSVTWTADQGTISPGGLYTAPNVSTSTTANVTATSVADPTQSATVQIAIQVVAGVAVLVNPPGVTLAPGATQQFTATVQNITDQTVTWSLPPNPPSVPPVGTISSSGLYTAPATITQTSYDTILATSVSYPAATGQASVTIALGIHVTVTPGSGTVPSGQTLQFSASVTGTTNQAVTWTTNLGTISTTGLFTAPTVTSGAIATITATSVADTTARASVQVSIQVNPTVVVLVNPPGTTLAPGATQQFTATVQGTTNQAVTWSLVPDPPGTPVVGTISSSGLYTAPASLAQESYATVLATSVAVPSVNGQASITITAGGIITQYDLVKWLVLNTRTTQHLVGDPSAPYSVQMMDTDPGYPANYPKQMVWQIKNKLGNPWDAHTYDANYITHWITEDGDAVDQAACQAANGTTCWLYAKAYKRYLEPVNVMPRMFTPGTTITIDNPAPNDVNRTTNCETTFSVVHIGAVRGVTSGPFKISWGGSIDSGSGTLANGPNYDNVHGVDTIKNQYMYSGTPATGFADVEEYYFVLGFGEVAWYHYHNGVYQQKTVNTVLASGGSPAPNFPCGPGKTWFVTNP